MTCKYCCIGEDGTHNPLCIKVERDRLRAENERLSGINHSLGGLVRSYYKQNQALFKLFNFAEMSDVPDFLALEDRCHAYKAALENLIGDLETQMAFSDDQYLWDRRVKKAITEARAALEVK
jgi:hypothetical protein